jgi:hypothetical protein
LLQLGVQAETIAEESFSGTYTIEASSKDSPNCRGAGEIRLVQEGSVLSGDGSISGNCIGGPYFGKVSGSYRKNEFRITFTSEFSYSFFSDDEAMTPEDITGTYWGFGTSDSGLATLSASK